MYITSVQALHLMVSYNPFFWRGWDFDLGPFHCKILILMIHSTIHVDIITVGRRSGVNVGLILAVSICNCSSGS